MEARLFGNWTGKMEYHLYIDYGKVVTSVIDPLNSTPIMLTFYSRLRENVARAGLKYNFAKSVMTYAPDASRNDVRAILSATRNKPETA